MKTLAKPHFRDLPQGECAGVPILLKLWDRFDFSILLTQAGINKLRGVPTWMTAFLYVVGLISHCTSVSKMAEMAGNPHSAPLVRNPVVVRLSGFFPMYTKTRKPA